MKTVEDLEKQYAKVPRDMRKLRRWVGFKIQERDGKKTKIPFNAITGALGSSTNYHTWTSFDVAIMGCVKYGLDGLGFCLGFSEEDGVNYSGVDLDNHGEEDFDQVANDFIEGLNSYTEYSPSGKGIHIFIKGKKPEGRCRKSNIEMYGNGRFFTVTGNTIKAMPVAEREQELRALWEKYLKEEEKPQPVYEPVGENELVFGDTARRLNVQNVEYEEANLSDDELLKVISESDNGIKFFNLYHGLYEQYCGKDHSKADAALCQLLAFWTNRNPVQMDRIFRKSSLMRPKWDEYRGEMTYGEKTIERAISNQQDTFRLVKKTVQPVRTQSAPVQEQHSVSIEKPKSGIIQSQSDMVEFDEKGDPIVDMNNITFKHYPLNDTGNAERFYDYFGDLFKYNEDDKRFMFWTGKKWSRKMSSCVRKYANKLIDILNKEIKQTEFLYEKETDDVKKENLKILLKAQYDNVKRVSNKAGKDAMICELQVLHDIPVRNDKFDKQEELLNTDSGIVNLLTGDVYPFNRKYMLSKNTHCGVSFDEPKVWLKFLHDIFRRGEDESSLEETEEIIDVVQMALGESLTGRTNKDHMFILYGSGSNGKSTFIKVFSDCFGDYATSMSSEMLVSKGNSSVQSKEFSLDDLAGARAITTSETAEGQKLDEVYFKQMLSGEKIKAQKKYGDSYSFLPTFNPWMSTNNKPIIRATDDGTWRRIYFIPFLNKFKGANKDVTMPKKLAAERAQILGWMIQGAVKLHKDYNDNLPTPKCLDQALADYKKELDVVVAFLNDMTIPFEEMKTNTQEVYREYKNWCKENGEYQYNERKFRQEVIKKGYNVVKDRNRGEMFVGFKLVSNSKGLIFGE